MAASLPKGAWTLQEAKEKLEEKKKLQEEKKRPKRKVLKTINNNNNNTSNNNQNSNGAHPDDIQSEEPAKRPTKKIKTRMPPRKPIKHGTKKPSFESDDDDSFEMPARRINVKKKKVATPPLRTSDRIKNRIIEISSDSDPEILPLYEMKEKPKDGKSGSANVNNNLNCSPLRRGRNNGKESDSSDTPTPKKPSAKKRAPSRKVEKSPVKKPKVVLEKPKKNNKNDQINRKGKRKAGPIKAGNLPPLELGTVIHNSTSKSTFKLKEVLGKGGFGYIYITSCSNLKEDAVCKIEPKDNGPLYTEMHFYMRVCKEDKIAAFCKQERLRYLGVPHSICFGIHDVQGVSYRYLVMPKFNTDLLKIYNECNNCFSLDTTLLLTIRMLEALKFIHELDYVHADIKSGNMLLKNKDKEVYLADFGLATHYITGGAHKTYKEDRSQAHNGTKEYTSIDAHKGVSPSRRGDLQILGYCMVEWLGGTLPWKSVENGDAVRDQKIRYQKNTKKFLEECFDKNNLNSSSRKVVSRYLETTHKLKYDEAPMYTDLISSLQTGLKSPDKGYVSWK